MIFFSLGIQIFYLVRSFDKKNEFVVGLLLFPFIFFPILSMSKYIGQAANNYNTINIKLNEKKQSSKSHDFRGAI